MAPAMDGRFTPHLGHVTAKHVEALQRQQGLFTRLRWRHPESLDLAQHGPDRTRHSGSPTSIKTLNNRYTCPGPPSVLQLVRDCPRDSVSCAPCGYCPRSPQKELTSKIPSGRSLPSATTMVFSAQGKPNGKEKAIDQTAPLLCCRTLNKSAVLKNKREHWARSTAYGK